MYPLFGGARRLIPEAGPQFASPSNTSLYGSGRISSLARLGRVTGQPRELD
jgi:hypothetical protein